MDKIITSTSTLTDEQTEKMRQISQLQNSRGLRGVPQGVYLHQSQQGMPNPYKGFSKKASPGKITPVINLLKKHSELFANSSVTATGNGTNITLQADIEQFYEFLVRVRLGSQFNEGLDPEEAMDVITNQCVEMEVSDEFKKGALAAIEIILNNKHLEELL